ncbi:MAG: dethiobiotin synthase [Deltaproteobacteria bacterium]|nr:dethiobiotin synthase [Deltaproteobacteria bacterium]
MNNGLFITGTDTGVGKTVVAATLAYALHQRRLNFHYIKPVESGISSRDYLETKSDAALVKRAGFLPEPLNEIVPFRFREPLAPLLAARREGIELSGNELSECIKTCIKTSELTLVEGAGGLLAPLCPDYLVIDLIKDLQLPVLVVCRTSLGALNHTLLTLDRLRLEGIHLIGIIANHLTAATGIAEESFLTQLSEFDPITVLGELPFLQNPPSELKAWKKLTGHIDFDKLLRRMTGKT